MQRSSDIDTGGPLLVATSRGVATCDRDPHCSSHGYEMRRRRDCRVRKGAVSETGLLDADAASSASEQKRDPPARAVLLLVGAIGGSEPSPARLLRTSEGTVRQFGLVRALIGNTP